MASRLNPIKDFPAAFPGGFPPFNPYPKTNTEPVGIVPTGTYLTVKPALKAILDRMETRYANGHKVLFSSATEMESAETNHPDFKDRISWRPRQVWDVSYMLAAKKNRFKMLGAGLIEREAHG